MIDVLSKAHRTMPLELLFKTINAKLRGHYQYYGVTDNTREVKNALSIKIGGLL